MSKRGTNPNSLKALNEYRNRSGQRNRAAVQFSKSLRELIVKEGESSISDKDGKRHRKIELVVRQLYNKAIAGEGWAVTFIAERVEGKVKDQMELSGSLAVKGYSTISPDDWDTADDSNGNPGT